MFAQLSKMKHKFSHIDAGSLHWRIVSVIYGKSAKGKACTYYWFKLPSALVVFILIFALYIFVMVLRALWVFGAWFKGYRFTGNILDLDDEVSEDFKYLGYKVLHNGTRAWIAPWEAVIIPIVIATVFYLFLVNLPLGLTLLVTIVVAFLVAVFLYIITRTWKSPIIKNARKGVSDFVDGVCPALVIDGESEISD